MMAAISLFLALLLALSATHKFVAQQRLAVSAARLAGVSPALGLPLLATVAAIEALAALALLIPAARLGGALAAAALWLVYAAALARKQGEVLDCGCDFASRERPVTAGAALRPAMLSILALAAAIMPAPVWSLDTPFAALALLALWFAASELASLSRFERTRTW